MRRLFPVATAAMIACSAAAPAAPPQAACKTVSYMAQGKYGECVSEANGYPANKVLDMKSYEPVCVTDECQSAISQTDCRELKALWPTPWKPPASCPGVD